MLKQQYDSVVLKNKYKLIHPFIHSVNIYLLNKYLLNESGSVSGSVSRTRDTAVNKIEKNSPTIHSILYCEEIETKLKETKQMNLQYTVKR